MFQISFYKRRYLYQIAFRVGNIAGALSPRLCRRGEYGFRSHAYRAVILLVNISKGGDIAGSLHSAVGAIGIGILAGCHLLESVSGEEEDA